MEQSISYLKGREMSCLGRSVADFNELIAPKVLAMQLNYYATKFSCANSCLKCIMTSRFYLINYVLSNVGVSNCLLSWLQIGCYATEMILIRGIFHLYFHATECFLKPVLSFKGDCSLEVTLWVSEPNWVLQ